MANELTQYEQQPNGNWRVIGPDGPQWPVGPQWVRADEAEAALAERDEQIERLKAENLEAHGNAIRFGRRLRVADALADVVEAWDHSDKEEVWERLCDEMMEALATYRAPDPDERSVPEIPRSVVVEEPTAEQIRAGAMAMYGDREGDWLERSPQQQQVHLGDAEFCLRAALNQTERDQ